MVSITLYKRGETMAKEKVAEEKNRVFTKKYDQHLRVELTDSEIREAADEMARRLADKQEAEKGFDDVKAQFKGRITSAETDVDRCARLIRDKSEFRQVLCEETRDYKTSRIVIVRTDTGDIVTDRRMRDDELQMELELIERKAQQ
jgi:hypothetical protein